MYRDKRSRFGVGAEEQNDLYDLYRQPTDGKYQNYYDHHTGDTPFAAANGRRLTSARPYAVEQTIKHKSIEHAGYRQRENVGEGEETAVEDPAVDDVSQDVRVEAGRAVLTLERVGHLLVLEQDGTVEGEDKSPRDEYDDVGVTHRTYRHGRNRMHHGQVAIQGHEYQRVHASVGRDVNDVLVDLTPGRAERPDGYGITHGSERHTDDDEEEVGHGEVDDEEIGCVPHLAVGDDNDDD